MTDANLLSGAMSPYLRAHAGNPVPWRPWGEDAFAEAVRRDVPVFLSIGYATCHWCHVMARESFSDPAVAAVLAEHFVSVKVDREEHPDVDAAYMAQASAFTRELGWPLSVFLTPDGVAFHAGTYFPPEPVAGRPSFRQVLAAVTEAWTERRADVEAGAARIAEAVRAAAAPASATTEPDLARAVARLASAEDPEHGGFGTGVKFPCAPALGFLRTAGSRDLVVRTLERMSASPLRDPVDGGFFRYATRRDWSEPHYERMLSDNALLLGLLLDAVVDGAGEWARDAADGVARFLSDVLQLPGGGYASAQDSESTIDGIRSEGGYYRSEERDELDPPALDEKVLSGWNGLAIEAMARAGFVLGEARWTESARWAAEYVLENHREDGVLWRASTAERRSDVRGTLEDHGMLASGLLVLGSLTGEAAYVRAATGILDAVRTPEGFREPGDPVLAARGLAVEADQSEGASPSGPSACARASRLLHLLTADASRLADARRTFTPLAGRAEENPLALGAVLDELAHLARAPRQIVVLLPEGAEVPDAVRVRDADAIVVATDARARELAAAGVELTEGRASLDGAVTVYACEDFACRLPETIAP